MKIEIDKIQISSDRTPVILATVEQIAQSIKEIGLLNAITVSQDMVLIAGAHRLEACKKLGWTQVEANVVSLEGLKAELAELDENMMRNNKLHYIHRSERLARRKEIYEALYPETKKGSTNQYTKPLSAESADSKQSFVEDTAEKTGVSTRVIHEEVQIANNLDPEAKQEIIKNDIPKSEALAISRLPKEEQVPKIVNYVDAKFKKDRDDTILLERFKEATAYHKLWKLAENQDHILNVVVEMDNDLPKTLGSLRKLIELLEHIETTLHKIKKERKYGKERPS